MQYTAQTLAHAFDILDRAYAQHTPIAVVGMYSSGDDSAATMVVLESWSKARSVPFSVVHINTGIGIEHSRVHARQVATARQWAFTEAATPPNHYVRMVTGQERHRSVPGGFPGAPLHAMYYRELKDRRVADVLRNLKRHAKRNDRVMLVSGIRQQESTRRMGYATEINKQRAQVWVNPLFYQTKDDCLDLIEWANIPRNPASQTIHMSGECLCGAMNSPGELVEIRFWFPETAAYLDTIAAQVRAAGFNWGWDEPRPRWMAYSGMTEERWNHLPPAVRYIYDDVVAQTIPPGWTIAAWADLAPRERATLRRAQRTGQATFLPLCVGCAARQDAPENVPEEAKGLEDA
jgi:3'-phosphoadenosine 5'-phosphosulfate sulfotransferase (PAPS reductase)/FAD synthetase